MSVMLLRALARPSGFSKLHFERLLPVVMKPSPVMVMTVPPVMGPLVGEREMSLPPPSQRLPASQTTTTSTFASLASPTAARSISSELSI